MRSITTPALIAPSTTVSSTVSLVKKTYRRRLSAFAASDSAVEGWPSSPVLHKEVEVHAPSRTRNSSLPS
jgi:hypothetical protein